MAGSRHFGRAGVGLLTTFRRPLDDRIVRSTESLDRIQHSEFAPT
jgi:hypothetical protein